MDNGRVGVKIHPGYSGHVVLKFTGYTSWRITAIISIVSTIMLLVEFIKVYCRIGAEWRLVWTKNR